VVSANLVTCRVCFIIADGNLMSSSVQSFCDSIEQEGIVPVFPPKWILDFPLAFTVLRFLPLENGTIFVVLNFFEILSVLMAALERSSGRVQYFFFCF
jgi:hypothetical protein